MFFISSLRYLTFATIAVLTRALDGSLDNCVTAFVGVPSLGRVQGHYRTAWTAVGLPSLGGVQYVHAVSLFDASDTGFIAGDSIDISSVRPPLGLCVYFLVTWAFTCSGFWQFLVVGFLWHLCGDIFWALGKV